MEELEPCPFCGEEAKVAEEGSWTDQSIFYSVFCIRCRSQIYWFKTTEEAIEAWNTRAERTCEGHRCEETGEWVCHKCGGSLAGCMFEPVRDGFVDVPNFCPNCGAKVVE